MTATTPRPTEDPVIRVPLLTFYETVQQLGKTVDQLAATLTDVPGRVRSLERFRWRAAGAASILGAGVGSSVGGVIVAHVLSR